ncbi:adenylyltransferase/cytidyltransferase family protein [Halanaeroarchaeum sulfurireducens]|uniref:FAD synthase n=1 Tax=Halanaeroarchaeum sulfurireducens TaxID=1604004 RepID=A0A0F7PAA4_9EURY|nr:adenylyltransferase/cytidyltransferase family protein [Halanaeroarchaeum sulfurireducens]AKH97652.1 FAD synthase [Halanaeroarchaeum sulfurireducens]ALG82047.1 FAD synthase [Halanaeroarchaeum sulfurireducens]
MTRVVAQGTFDIIHPGHVHYLGQAAAMGDELHVIVARRQNVTHKEPPILPNRQRKDVVAALDVVDDARVGNEDDIFAPIEDLDPDVIALGHDQHHDSEAIASELATRGIDCAVRRVSAREPRYDGELLSTRTIIDRILETRSE